MVESAIKAPLKSTLAETFAGRATVPKMSRLTPTIVLAIAGLAVVAGRPSCNSVLRLNPAFAHLFTHCDCLRSEWTDWSAINRTAVPASQCPSLSTLTYQRKQQRISGECQDIIEHIIVCEPEVSDRIILALGLGSSEFIPTSTPPSGPTGQPGTTPLGPSGPSNSPPPTGPPGSCHGKRSLNYNFNDDIHDDIINDDPNNQYLLCPPAPAPTTPPPPPLITVPRPGSLPPGSIRPGPLGGGPLGKRSPAGLDGDRSRRHAGQICRHFTVPRQQGRRSVRDELKGVKMNRRQSANEPEPLPVDPIPFNVGEHGSRYRRSHRDNCREQYILFVLDASGSIGKQWFDRVTELLAELVLYFCKPIRVATMTFDDRFFAEFCFDEYDNSSSGRVGASAAINATDYRRHGRLTHTGGAAKCVCEYMLTDTCGFPVDAGCTDVIFFTDGRANDPILDICTEIDCLHDSRDVDTFAIGVGNYNDLSLGCYGKNGLQLDEYHLFDFANFATLEREFEIVIQKLNDTAHNGGDYECASTRVDPRER